MTRICVPGYAYQESDAVGDVKIAAASDGGQSVNVGRDGLAVLIYQKE